MKHPTGPSKYSVSIPASWRLTEAESKEALHAMFTEFNIDVQGHMSREELTIMLRAVCKRANVDLGLNDLHETTVHARRHQVLVAHYLSNVSTFAAVGCHIHLGLCGRQPLNWKVEAAAELQITSCQLMICLV